MDKFLEITQKMQKMTPEERKAMMEKNLSLCMCKGCPTYSACMKELHELLFCSTEKSTCAVEMKGCLCPTCPVTPVMGLAHSYYCKRGSEKDIRGL